jgi:acyl-CoA reductase-like NAD-dependent aldehyde dehydrogenase
MDSGPAPDPNRRSRAPVLIPPLASMCAGQRTRLTPVEHFSRPLATGTVWINSYNRLFAEAETGGYRESGIGRLHGLEGLNDFLQTKHIYYETLN